MVSELYTQLDTKTQSIMVYAHQTIFWLTKKIFNSAKKNINCWLKNVQKIFTSLKK